MRKLCKVTCLMLAMLLTAAFAAPLVPQASAENITLRFSWWGSDSRHEPTLAVIEKYMQDHPGVIIEAEYGGFDGYEQKLSTQLAGGTEPDIMQVDQPWMDNYMMQGDFFVDFYDYKDIFDMSGFDEKFVTDFGLYDGKLVALPTGLNSISFLGNKKVLDEAGVSFGDVITWDDLLNEGKKVNANNPDNYLLNIDRGSDYFVTQIYVYQLTGRQIVNSDYTLGVTKEEFAEALAFTQKLYEGKVIIPLEESLLFQGSPQDNPGWNNGQYGGWFNWASTANFQDWDEGDAIALPYPKLANGVQSSYIVRPSQVITVSKNCKWPEQAMDFLNYFYNDEEAILTLKDCRAIPVVENARTLLTENGLITQVVTDTVALAMQDVGNRANSLPSEITAVIDTVFEKLIFKQYDANAAAEEAFILFEDVLQNLKAAQS